MPDEVFTPTSDTPTGDALANGAPPPATDAAASADNGAAAAAPGSTVDDATKARIIDEYRKGLKNGLAPEQIAIREAKRKHNEAVQAFEGTRASYDQQIADLKADIDAAVANPFAWAAKKRGVTEAEVYNERTKRGIDPIAAEMDDLRKEVGELKEDKKKSAKDAEERAEQDRQNQIAANFRNAVLNVFKDAAELKFLKAGVEDGEFMPENIALEVERRVKAHHHRTWDETGEGEILDPVEVLQTIEKELREEAKRKRDRLAKLESPGEPGIPDREGAVKPATHEAKPSSTGPRTLTNAHASQTSGKQRPLTRREQLIEAEKRLRGG